MGVKALTLRELQSYDRERIHAATLLNVKMAYDVYDQRRVQFFTLLDAPRRSDAEQFARRVTTPQFRHSVAQVSTLAQLSSPKSTTTTTSSSSSSFGLSKIESKDAPSAVLPTAALAATATTTTTTAATAAIETADAKQTSSSSSSSSSSKPNDDATSSIDAAFLDTFRALDVDRNDSVSLAEFCASASLTLDEFRKRFAYVDADGDATLTRTEWLAYGRKLYPNATSTNVLSVRKLALESKQFLFFKQMEHEAQIFWDLLDVHRDGELEYEVLQTTVRDSLPPEQQQQQPLSKQQKKKTSKLRTVLQFYDLNRTAAASITRRRFLQSLALRWHRHWVDPTHDEFRAVHSVMRSTNALVRVHMRRNYSQLLKNWLYVFECVDLDNSNSISLDEWCNTAHVPASQMAIMFSELDTDSNQVLTRDEWLVQLQDAFPGGVATGTDVRTYARLLQRTLNAIAESLALQAFRLQDRDGSNTLCVREVHAVLQALGTEYSADAFVAFFASLDEDSNGTISADEYVASALQDLRDAKLACDMANSTDLTIDDLRLLHELLVQ
jgi:hypothetical protein